MESGWFHRISWDHLRVCGADGGQQRGLTSGLGSSPRVRSRRTFESVPSVDAGIISACAEQTPRRSSRTRPARDHLRVCGADYGVKCDGCGIQGSSPRVRSRLRPRKIRFHVRGIISACAEQTTGAANHPDTGGDHLRVCGADCRADGGTDCMKGSSPRVRSRLPAGHAGGGQAGIISACAEQTMTLPTNSLNLRDHLRVCGADEICLCEYGCALGSSPRVRSRPYEHPHQRDEGGIISACAEQTRLFGFGRLLRKDHLRVCGADNPNDTDRSKPPGSSPRVRSRPQQVPQAGATGGIISACAEQTFRCPVLLPP